MPDVVTFDPIRLLIIEIPVYTSESPTPSPLNMADNVTSFVEIYSEYKEWAARKVSPSGGLGFPPAIRVVGGDPSSDTENLGSTFFMTNGWRLKPAEGNHKWTVEGNVGTDPAGQSIFVRTDGPYSTHTETKFSNLVIQTVNAVVDSIYQQVERQYYINTTLTDSGDGSLATPFNNVADLKSAALVTGVFNIRVLADLTLTSSLAGFMIRGTNGVEIGLAGFSVEGSRFEGISLAGNQNGNIFAENCILRTGMTNLEGRYLECGLQSTLSVRPGEKATMASCFSDLPGQPRPIVSVSGANTRLGVRGYSGGFELADADSTCNVTIEVIAGKITVADSCTAGFISLRGTGWLDDQSAGSTIDKLAFISGEDTQISRKILQNKTHTDPNMGIMTVYDDDDVTVLLQGDLFEDVAAVQRYRGQGAERRERLT